MTSASTQRYSIFSRFIGLVADLGLYALFLLLGLTLINVLVQLIVLVVGIVASAPAGEMVATAQGIVYQDAVEENRLGNDITDMVIALIQVVVCGGIYWGYLRLRRRFLHLFGDPGFELFVSKRYLIAREGGQLVGLITIISVLGVAVGVMALIVVIGVMDGFDRSLVNKFMGVFSHIQIKPHPHYSDTDVIPVEEAERVIDWLEKQPFVEAAAPIYDHQTIILKDRNSFDKLAYAKIRGIDPDREKDVTRFMSYVTHGSARPGPKEIVLGELLAQKLRVGIGEYVYPVGKMIRTANRDDAKRPKLMVVGTFKSGLYDVDEAFAYTDISTVQQMLLSDGNINSIHLKTTNAEEAKSHIKTIYENIPAGYWVFSWQDMSPAFFQALKTEKIAMAIILLLIVLVASFNIIGTLIMTVVQKTRDIGVLKSLGATRTAIMKIFLFHGFLVGLMGTSLGVVWGVRLCLFVQNDIEKIFNLPEGIYGMDRLPVVIDLPTIATIAGCSMLICLVASIIPAFQASRLKPVEALRYD